MAETTKIGFMNPRGQEVLGLTGQPGSDHLQRVYVLKCSACAFEYGANGTDIARRRCPNCGGGRPGFGVTADDIVDVGAEPPKARARNPNWTRDELILALDVYFDVTSPHENHPAVIALSTLLNRFWASSDHQGANLRNATGVSMKLSNFQRLDPRRQASGLKGLSHGGQLEEEIWREFGDDHVRLRTLAAAIRAALDELSDTNQPTTSHEDVEAAEGALLTSLHHYRERDRGLAKRRKAKAFAEHGALICEACDFDFAKIYGARGEGYIEVHHTRALETLQPGARTKLSELAILCANCHRMIHARRPWLTVSELRDVVHAPAGD